MSIQLLHGDCVDLMKTLPDKSIDCFICDLPYGCLTGGGNLPNRKGSSYGQNGCDWDIKIDLELFWEQVKRLMKNDNVPIIQFCNTRFGAELIASNPSWFRYDLIWNKEIGVGFLNANKQPLRSHENIYIFAKKGAFYKRIDEYVEGAKSYYKRVEKLNSIYGTNTLNERSNEENTRCSKSILTFKTIKGKGNHPTQKPIELYKWLLSRYYPEGGTILDPTAGSFSSCEAGKELGLTCIGIEKDDAFYKKAILKFEP